MRGQISLTFEREPSYFTLAEHTRDEAQTIVAETSDHRIVCAGEISYRRCWVNGAPRDVGYLGALRLDRSVAAHHAILRGGYRFASTLARPGAVYFTSIIADNARARRFLEAGVRGMPRYEPIDRFTTFILPARRSEPIDPSVREARAEDCVSLRQLFDEANRQRQFTPCEPDVNAADLLIAKENDRLVVAGGICDQRAYKQVVVRGYSGTIAIVRPALNALSWLTGTPRLPRVGMALQHACASPIACSPGAETAVPRLLPALQRRAATRGIEMLMIGCSHRDPLHGVLATYSARARRYESQLYRVHWGDTSLVLDTRPAAPDVAWL